MEPSTLNPSFPPSPKTPPPTASAAAATCSSPVSITPQQRQRMESNRRLALARQQFQKNHHHTVPSSHQQLLGSTSISDNSTLTHQQEEVLAAVSSGRSVFITGSAGTGKSFLLRHAVAALRRIHRPDRVYVTASTGVAACALGGQTLHSFAGMGLGQGSRNDLLARASNNRKTLNRWLQAEALVIDEISMVDGQLFDNLEYIARTIRSRTAAAGGATVIWGGIQLVVSGDFFQLPPINAPNPNKEFAFEAACWDTTFDLQMELTRIFRQSDSDLIHLLEGIRQGRSDLGLDRVSSNIIRQGGGGHCGSNDNDDGPGVTRLFPRNEDVRRVNNDRLRGLGKELVIFKAFDKGQEPWKGQLRQGIAPDELSICLGARVMLIKNTDHAMGLVNGATGVVTGFVKEEGTSAASDICPMGLLPTVLFDTSGVELAVEPERWDVMEGNEVLATRRQIPLILAWALSVHKCQGMTLDRLHTDLSRAFGCGMVYVALSRVRSLEGLRLSGFNPLKIKAHPKVLIFYRKLLLQAARS